MISAELICGTSVKVDLGHEPGIDAISAVDPKASAAIAWGQE
ncbi:MAG: hypothetical protein NXI27_13865 [Alphaproteobacteria bacterium]|nr:hypothetical protein [Alphaproteobacteria bacterium]